MNGKKKPHRLSRREFNRIAVAAPVAASLVSTVKPMQFQNDYAGGVTDIPGIRVGHFTETRRPTGCTVILTESGATAGVDVRGSAPGTRETDLLNPVNTVDQVHGIVLAGGSAFGLDSASGAVQYLEEKGVGLKVGPATIPIVPAAILFDLGVGDASIRPDKAMGYKACRNATDGLVQEGSLGAGAGATVGKMFGMGRAMKAGIGSFSIQIGDLVVAALVAVNAVGDVRDPATGEILAGARTEDGRQLFDVAEYLRENSYSRKAPEGENTTLGVVATNAQFNKTQMTKVAQMAHDGYARAINPVHMPSDGDTVFALSLGSQDADLGQVGFLAAEATAQAIVRAVKTALGARRIPAYYDLKRMQQSN